MLIKELIIEDTKIKFYDDCITENITIQKEYIDKTITDLRRIYDI